MLAGHMLVPQAYHTQCICMLQVVSAVAWK